MAPSRPRSLRTPRDRQRPPSRRLSARTKARRIAHSLRLHPHRTLADYVCQDDVAVLVPAFLAQEGALYA